MRYIILSHLHYFLVALRGMILYKSWLKKSLCFTVLLGLSSFTISVAILQEQKQHSSTHSVKNNNEDKTPEAQEQNPEPNQPLVLVELCESELDTS